jgi:UDPglucose--hexose-1-phosphate uridylyltransferase
MSNVKLPRIDGKTVYRRHFVKADGRDLFLYGYTPHSGAPLNQMQGDVAKGGELRWHPLRQEWNIYAPHRQNRTFKPSAADDPLAPTQRGGPATEIPFEDFELAIFENKFTSLHAEAPLVENLSGLKRAQALGHCDVIVYTPEPTGSLYTIGQEKRRLLLSAWIDRYDDLKSRGLAFILPFESRGEAVGVTLHHPHGQIYAFDHIPPTQRKMADAFSQGFDLAKNMTEFGNDYTVTKAEGFKVICPPYARFPYESWIVPTRRRAGPWAFNAAEQESFAFLLGDMTRRYDALFDEPMPYMLSLQAAPKGHEEHWHFTAQLYPLHRAKSRVKYLASVEQSTGAFTVDVMPEMAAETLRAL